MDGPPATQPSASVPKLQIRFGQHSEKGSADKQRNQDFHGSCHPTTGQLRSKGVALAIADGIGSSEVSHIAAETAVSSFLADYYCTSDAWSVKRSAQRVIAAANGWLYGQTHRSPYRFDQDRGYVCTFSALVFKQREAHLFHVGDARIYRLRDGVLEQLSEDHRYWLSRQEHYLSRALGIADHVEIDYRRLPLARGDVFIAVTDGVHEFVTDARIAEILRANPEDADAAAHALVAEAAAAGSDDDRSVQIARVEQLPEVGEARPTQAALELPLPPALSPRQQFDGFEILRELHVSSRSQVFLAVDTASGRQVALKVPGSDLRQDPELLERFLLEEWIARRIDSPHVVQAITRGQPQQYLYVVTEYIEGQSLRQWMRDHPEPDLESVRTIVEQIAKGMLAFHRQEMIHQDLRPENVLIDTAGIVKLIDFGAAAVGGIMESASEAGGVLGTEQYAAPEYFLGEGGSTRSDIYSLGVIAYEMLTGELPYGTRVPSSRTRAAQRRLKYGTALRWHRDTPVWMDGALRKAVHIDPERRYQEVSELAHDLRHPRRAFLAEAQAPLIARNPVRFWQGVSFLLGGLVLVLLLLLAH